MIKLSRIHHVAIIVSDYQKSKRFYTETLGLQVINETYRKEKERDSYKLDLKISDTDQIELFSFPGAPERLSYPEAVGLRHIAFEVDDIAAVKTQLEIKGVQVEDIRVDEVTGKKFTFFSDPDYLPIELYQK